MAQRGYHPDDSLKFAGEQLAILQRAHQDIRSLLDRGYRLGPILELVGGRYQLTARQRNALQRTAASSDQCRRRAVSRLPLSAADGKIIQIDGFNLLVTLETALSGSPLFLGSDGVIRDLAGLRGSYHLIPQTDQATALLGRILGELSVGQTQIYLDAPVSNSGRLRQHILHMSVAWPFPTEVNLIPNPDTVLCRREWVVTSDSLILDHCASWLDLTGAIIRRYIPQAWIISFNE